MGAQGVIMRRALSLLILLVCAAAEAQPHTRPVPPMQAVPQPHHEVSFQRDGAEIARYHFGSALRRPFIFPLVGPSGRSLTRMGHPHDPEGHSHHNSVWVSHHSVNGVSFWGDRGKGKIAHKRIEAFHDDAPVGTAALITESVWIDEGSGRTLLNERRRTAVKMLDGGELLLTIDFQLGTAGNDPVILGKTPFGMVGVRMAKTIGTNDGGGEIRNSEGASGEKDVFWKKAKWVDYSGPITATATEGITLMDHPHNVGFPNAFHVRADGWMGSALTLNEEIRIEPARPLVLRYGLYAHAGKPAPEALEKVWAAFAESKLVQPPKGTK